MVRIPENIMKEEIGRRTCRECGKFVWCAVGWSSRLWDRSGNQKRWGWQGWQGWWHQWRALCLALERRKSPAEDTTVPELFRVLWLLLLIGFFWSSTSDSIYFRVRERILHTLVEPSMVSITLVPTYLFSIKVFYDTLQCSCEES